MPHVGKIYALIVGINAYTNISQLNYSVNDAYAFNNAIAPGGSNNIWNDAEITILTDSDATRANIISSIDRIGSSIEDGDIFVMFYSGHGSETTSGSEQYICPSDAISKNAGTMISTAQLNSLLSEYPENSTKILIFDSCFSGGFAKNVADSEDSGIRAKFVPLEDNPVISKSSSKGFGSNVSSLISISASDEDETSWESSAIEHGYFTYSLIAVLGQTGSIKGTGFAGDTISAEEVFKAAAAGIGTTKQHPQFKRNGADQLVKGVL